MTVPFRQLIAVIGLTPFVVGAIPVPAAGQESLYLTDGRRIEGVNRGFADDGILWQNAAGRTSVFKLSDVDRIEYPLPPPPAFDISPGYSTAIPGPPIDEPFDDDSVHTGWSLLQPTADAVRNLFHSSLTGFTNWTQRVEAGGRFLDGNSDEDFINAAGKFERTIGNSVSQLDFSGQYGRSDGDVTSNRWNANATFDYGRHGNWIVFAAAKNEFDEFENLDYRGTYSSGFGYRFYNEKDRRLIVRVGPAVTYERFRDPVVNRTTPDGFGELEIIWPILSRSSFETKTSVHPRLSDMSIVRLVSNNGLLFRLDEHGRWKLKLGFRFEYNSDPNKGKRPADYTTTLLLVYTRK